MANNLKIVITAVDQATASVRRINASIARITAPVRAVGRSVANLGRELGLDKVGKSLGQVAGSAKRVAGAVGSIAAPLAGVIGAGSIAGVAALATEWGRMGIEVANTSRGLGITTSQLQGLRGAAQMAGIGSESLAGGLQSLGDTINDARWGRNQGALALMSRLGIRFHQTVDGSVDVVRSLKDISAAVGNIKSVQTQRLVAREFGVEALLPLLRKGGKAIDEYQKKAAALGAVQSPAAIAQAEAFGYQLNFLNLATQGLRNSIAEKLTPVLMPLIEQLTSWIAKNRELIAGKVANFVREIAKWLQQVDFNKTLDGVTRFIEKVDVIVDKLGGWKTVAIGLGLAMTANVLAPVLSLAASLTSLSATIIPAAIRGLALLGGAQAAAGAAAAGAAGAGAGGAAAAGAAGAGAAGAAAGAGALTAGALARGALAGATRLALPLAALWGLYEIGRTGFALKDLYDIQHREGVGLTPGARARVRAGALNGMSNPAIAPLGIRSNNPLNIQRNGREAVFPTMELGIANAYDDLYGKIGRGINTPAAIVNRWSPPNAPGNSAAKNANYVKSIEDVIGSGPIDRDNSDTMAKLISTMARFENGAAQADKAGVDQAVQHVVVEFRNPPPGTTATAKTQNGNSTPVRIVMAMPSGGMP
jgi:hypothetical protein